MAPNIVNQIEDKGILKFTIQDINVSFVNAIRRCILSEISIVVFKTFPHSENDSEFLINTSRFNNEIIKQRLSCIPINLDKNSVNIEELLLEVHVKNETNQIIFVTTQDFKIKNTVNNLYLSNEAINQIFPPNQITNDYIDLLRLRPKISEEIEGEEIKLNCKFSIGRAKDNGSFNVVSTCSFSNSPDNPKISMEWDKKMEKINQEEDKLTPKQIDYLKKDWSLLEAKRYYLPNSFNFILKGIGILNNKDILFKSVDILINNLQELSSQITQSSEEVIVKSENTINNCYDIKLDNQDHTLGKVIENILYENYFLKDKILTFCSFNKFHPHINNSIIRLAFTEEVDIPSIYALFENSCRKAIDTFQEIKSSIELVI